MQFATTPSISRHLFWRAILIPPPFVPHWLFLATLLGHHGEILKGPSMLSQLRQVPPSPPPQAPLSLHCKEPAPPSSKALFPPAAALSRRKVVRQDVFAAAVEAALAGDHHGAAPSDAPTD